MASTLAWAADWTNNNLTPYLIDLVASAAIFFEMVGRENKKNFFETGRM